MRNSGPLSRRRLLYGVAAAGVAASSGGSVGAFLADREGGTGTFSAGSLDLDVAVSDPAWADGTYSGSIELHETNSTDFELTVSSNPAFVWLLTPCPTCEPIEEHLAVRLELSRPGAETVELFAGTLGGFRDQFYEGGLLSTAALPTDEAWTLTLTWTLLAPVEDSVDFGFSFQAMQSRHLDDPTTYAFDRPECDSCTPDEPVVCGQDISYAAFCSDQPLTAADLSFSREICGDTDREATLVVTEIPDHVDEVLLKYSTNLDVFEYDGESTPFSVTTGGSSEDLTFVTTYEQQGGEYPESGDPPRSNNDPCPGKYWLKTSFGGATETGSPDAADQQGGGQ